MTDFKAQIQWYGSFVTITDQVQYVVQDRVLNEATKVFSLQLGLDPRYVNQGYDGFYRKYNCMSNGLNGNTPTEITDADIQTP